jgi:hypothetical protein
VHATSEMRILKSLFEVVGAITTAFILPRRDSSYSQAFQRILLVVNSEKRDGEAWTRF